MSKFLTWIVAAAVTVTGLGAAAETDGPTVSAHREVDSIRKLPAGFPQLTDYRRLWRDLWLPTLMKDKYETTAAFNTRLDESFKALRFGEGGIGDYILIDEDRMWPVYDYDAEHAEFRPKASSLFAAVAPHPATVTVTLASNDSPAGEYVAVNAMGAQRTVHRVKSERWVLQIANLQMPDGPKRLGEAMTLKMPPEQARLLDTALTPVFVVKLTKPYTDAKFATVRPTFTLPEEVEKHTNVLVVELHEVWLVNRATGEIITKRKIPAATPPQKVTNKVPAESLNPADVAAISNSYIACWNPPSTARGTAGLAVAINVEFNRDGSVKTAGYADKDRMSDPEYRAAAESALRAVLNPRCRIKPPVSSYESWRSVTLNFRSPSAQ